MYCKQSSKSDQVPDLIEKAYLTQKSQVPELNETHLVEGMKQLNNDDSYLSILPNIVEKETHVHSSEQADIGQVLVDIVEDQSEVYRRAEERAISGLSQSNQWRLGKSDGEPGTRLPAIKSDRQSQKVGLGNLSLNSPTVVTDNMFQDLLQDLDCYLTCYSKCVTMDEFGIWSDFVEILDFVKAGIDSQSTYSIDQRKHQNSKIKYFYAAFSNIPNDQNISVDQNYNSKKEIFDAANCNKPSV